MSKKVICFGEVLWDVFPGGEKIGGAPLNVALRLKSLGVATTIVSKVGKDQLGKRLIDFIHQQGIGTEYIQQDAQFETGKVNVTLDQSGAASYEIAYPAAWDKIDLVPTLEEEVAQADLFLFGSLVTRDVASKKSLLALLKKASFKVFDVNLRAPHYSQTLIEDLMQKADLIKFNDEELAEISKAMGCQEKSLEKQLRFISAKTNTPKVCVTKGGDGALLLLNDQLYDQKGFPIKVVDTVGAGDSFLATLLEGILTNKAPEIALEKACAMGAMVASSTGANPKITPEELHHFIKASK
ncbi:MAG: PfkB family carbohydrate kinase [Candidatus Arcticimaribacter sp.]